MREGACVSKATDATSRPHKTGRMDEAVDFMEREDTNHNNAASDQQQLGSKYLLGEQLGRGAMGVVFAGSTRDGEELAVKILRPELSSDTKTVSRFIQERQIFSRVNHPNVVRVHDLVAEGDRLGIVMERVSGGDLKARIEAGTVTPTQAVRISAAIADGLQAIHDVDVIHRDLKPANILLTTDKDGRLMPKISDFGISRLVSEAMTRTSTTIGTPLYMAPESADQRGAGRASDVYALGAMLFEMLTGTPPFHQGGTFAVLRSHALDAPARVIGVPARLTDLIDAMLAKEPASRPSVQTTRELLLSLLPEMDDADRPSTVPVGPAAAAGIAAAGAAAAGISGEVGNSSETVVSNPGFDGPNDSSETIVAGVAGNQDDSSETIAAAGFSGPSDSSETVVADLHAASTGPSAGGSGPADSSETIVSSTMFGAAAAGAGGAGVASAAPAAPAAPVAPTPPSMPGHPAHLAGAATGGSALGAAAQTGGGAGGGTPIGTSDRAFDRVPRRVIEVGAVLASMAAVALIAFFVLNGGDGSGDVSATEPFGNNDETIDPEGASKNQEQVDDDSSNGRSGFDEGESDEAEGGSSSGTTATSDSNANNGSDDGETDVTTATTEPPTTTTEKTTTTEQETTTTTEPPATTEPPVTEPPVTEPPVTEPPVTEPPVTEPPVTEPPITIGPVATPIAIVSGPTVNQVGSTSFQFTYNTNGVCGSGSFNVVRKSDGVSVGSFSGDGTCYGPLHGGFPGAGAFAGINIEPGTSYTVNVTVNGVDGSSGSLVAGSGSASRSFSVTTNP